MAKIGGIELLNGFASGGAFALAEPPSGRSGAGSSKEISDIELSDNWVASVDENTGYIVVQSTSVGDPEDIFENSYDAATRALDVFSIVTDFEGRCVNAHNDHIVWWSSDNGESQIRFVGTAPFNVQSRAEVTINGERPEPTIPDWHESFRYYRLSKTTEDLFDAYRNQFLALEHLLSDLCPKQSNEGESEWMQRALQEGHDQYDLSNFAPNENNPVQSIHGWQYEHIRCGMFHSKAGHKRLQPRNQSDTESVRNALHDLTRIYSHLVRNKFDRSISTGGLTYAGFDRVTRWMEEEGPQIVIHPQPVDHEDEEDSFEISSDSEVLDAEYFEQYSTQRAKYVRSKVSSNDLSNTVVREIDLINQTEEKTIAITHMICENDVELTGFNTLEVIKGLKLRMGTRSGVE